ncbi:MAG: 2-oxoacid:ferredoxin oxidoreductase subunit gamma [Caldiserica bacterium]|nr:MAG: 2-oxoacid:ferredoxin oxidoreductase subunit gamma [Caldisericota bacterium]
MKRKILISGFGGQGIMVAGIVLGEAAIKENLEVTFFPSYGAEMRGGTANCKVIISNEKIGSPNFKNPDVLISMNQQSFDRFSKDVKKGGIVVFNSSICKAGNVSGVNVYGIPANEIAEKVGSLKSANMVIIGYLLKIDGFLDIEKVYDVIGIVFSKKKEFIDINKNALKEGYNYGKESSFK